MKTCTKCLKEKPVDQFYSQRKVCKTCIIERNVARVRAQTGAARQERLAKASQYQKTEEGKLARLRAKLKYKYQITPEIYTALLEGQGGTCFLCGEEETVPHHSNDKLMSLAVDHDHKCCPGSRCCGKCIRGLLCYNCNRYMGRVDKSAKLRERFTDYVSRRALEDV